MTKGEKTNRPKAPSIQAFTAPSHRPDIALDLSHPLLMIKSP